jgi:hypothetical protein
MLVLDQSKSSDDEIVCGYARYQRNFLTAAFRRPKSFVYTSYPSDELIIDCYYGGSTVQSTPPLTVRDFTDKMTTEQRNKTQTALQWLFAADGAITGTTCPVDLSSANETEMQTAMQRMQTLTADVPVDNQTSIDQTLLHRLAVMPLNEWDEIMRGFIEDSDATALTVSTSPDRFVRCFIDSN